MPILQEQAFTKNEQSVLQALKKGLRIQSLSFTIPNVFCCLIGLASAMGGMDPVATIGAELTDSVSNSTLDSTGTCVCLRLAGILEQNK